MAVSMGRRGSRIWSGVPARRRSAAPTHSTRTSAAAAGRKAVNRRDAGTEAVFRIRSRTFQVSLSVHSAERTLSSRDFLISIFFIKIPSLQFRLQEALGPAEARVQGVDVRAGGQGRFLQG